MAAAVDLTSFVRPLGDGLLQMTLAVDGVNCGRCISKIETALRKLPAVVEARLNFTNRRLTLAWRKDAIEPAEFVQQIESLGYHAYPFQARSVELEEQRQSKLLLRCLAVAGFAAMNIMLLSVS